MARESFVFHFEYIQDIPDELRGQWTMAIIDYAQTGIQPRFDDWRDLKIWNKIKNRIDNEEEKYQKRNQNLRQNTLSRVSSPSQVVQKSIQDEEKGTFQKLHFFDNSDSVTTENTKILSGTEAKNSDSQQNLSDTESKTGETQEKLSVPEDETCENMNSPSVGVSVTVNESVTDDVPVNESEFVCESETVSVYEQKSSSPYQEIPSVHWDSPGIVHQKFWERLHSEWVGAGLPLSKTSEQSFFHFSCRELKAALEHWHGKGLQLPEIMAAFKNYCELAKLISSGGSWMKSVGGFDFFAKRILEWLPGAFTIESYKVIGGKALDTRAQNKDYKAMLMEIGIKD